MPSSETLMTIALDLQIKICTFLHPSDILALRKTCKILQNVTKCRIVWIDALRRICFNNSLFLPSFPILDMSDMELEHAATAPYRWIKLCAGFAKQNPGPSEAMLRPISTRVIKNPDSDVFLVPGGRYLVGYSHRGICVWDIGYTSNVDAKLLASGGPEEGTNCCIINATSDGMGLIIVAFRDVNCSVYEIYPQNETPQLTPIAKRCFRRRFESFLAGLLPDKVVCYNSYDGRTAFTVWDYRLNHSICLSADVDLSNEPCEFEVVVNTETIIVLCDTEISAWGIPPLSPQPPDFLNQNPIHIPPLFRVRITMPPDLGTHERICWETFDSWYCGSSKPLYFGVKLKGPYEYKIHDLEIVIRSDLSDASLRVINTCQLSTSEDEATFPESPSICEGTLVTLGKNFKLNRSRTMHIRSMSSCPSEFISPGDSVVLKLFLSEVGIYNPSLCPSSGRVVHLSDENASGDEDVSDGRKIYIVDFL